MARLVRGCAARAVARYLEGAFERPEFELRCDFILNAVQVRSGELDDAVADDAKASDVELILQDKVEPAIAAYEDEDDLTAGEPGVVEDSSDHISGPVAVAAAAVKHRCDENDICGICLENAKKWKQAHCKHCEPDVRGAARDAATQGEAAKKAFALIKKRRQCVQGRHPEVQGKMHWLWEWHHEAPNCICLGPI